MLFVTERAVLFSKRGFSMTARITFLLEDLKTQHKLKLAFYKWLREDQCVDARTCKAYYLTQIGVQLASC